MDIRVAKFGGTSMQDAEAITRAAQITRSIRAPKAIVVSATAGTTDQLIALGKLALINADVNADVNGGWKAAIDELRAKHEKIADDLGIAIDLSPYFDELQNLVRGVSLVKELSPSVTDQIATFGERISAQLLAAHLRNTGEPSEAVDAFNLIFTDNEFGGGNVDFDRTNAATQAYLAPLLRKGITPVITGFIGQSKSGQYIILGRGGSDYTGAIIAAALKATELQIWTDVAGIFNADPRMIASARPLPQLSYREAGELAFFGAKVLHPKTIRPAVHEKIPVKILNSFAPDAPGTIINGDEVQSLKSVTYRKNIDIVNVTSSGMLEAKGFLARLFSVFAKHDISVDVVSTSEVSVSSTVDAGMSNEVVADLEKFCTVSVHKNMAIVCLVGENIRSDPGILGRLFAAISDHNIMMVSQGSSKRNITFVVREDEVSAIVTKVFNTFFA